MCPQQKVRHKRTGIPPCPPYVLCERVSSSMSAVRNLFAERSTLKKQWKWLFVNGSDSKDAVPAVAKIVNSRQRGRKSLISQGLWR